MFGEGATYDSIETRYRVVKKQAKQLADEIANGERPAEAAPTPRKRKVQTQTEGSPTPAKRVTSAKGRAKGTKEAMNPSTPTKKKVVFKREVVDLDDSEEEEPWSAGEDEPENVNGAQSGDQEDDFSF